MFFEFSTSSLNISRSYVVQPGLKYGQCISFKKWPTNSLIHYSKYQIHSREVSCWTTPENNCCCNLWRLKLVSNLTKFNQFHTRTANVNKYSLQWRKQPTNSKGLSQSHYDMLRVFISHCFLFDPLRISGGVWGPELKRTLELGTRLSTSCAWYSLIITAAA